MWIRKCGVAAVVVGVGLAAGVATPAAAYEDGRYAFAGIADWDGDGHQDIIARYLYSTADLWMFPGQSVRAYSTEAPATVGYSWNGYTFAGIADWDGDGHQDIVAREDYTGILWLYPGQSVRGYSTAGREQIGNGWKNYSLAGVADWDADGHQDLLARDNTSGVLWLYPGQSVRGYSTEPRVSLGGGWTQNWYFEGIADWDADGHQDIIARTTTTMDLWLYPGQSVRGHSTEPGVQIGNGWYGYWIAGIADWDGDGHQDIVARYYETHDLWLYPGQSVRGYSTEPRVRIGENW